MTITPDPTYAADPALALSAEQLAAQLSESSRLDALVGLHLLQRSDAMLDGLARSASKLLGVPIVLVTVVDSTHQYFLGLEGLTGWAAEARVTPLTHSFCQYVAGTGQALVVEDATRHPVLQDNPAIGEFGVVAYAGVPLTMNDGSVAGAFCAIDREPREWTPDQVALLMTMSNVASAQLELRKSMQRVIDGRGQEERAH